MPSYSSEHGLKDRIDGSCIEIVEWCAADGKIEPVPFCQFLCGSVVDTDLLGNWCQDLVLLNGANQVSDKLFVDLVTVKFVLWPHAGADSTGDSTSTGTDFQDTNWGNSISNAESS